jgi:hypothetical protein
MDLQFSEMNPFREKPMMVQLTDVIVVIRESNTD